VPCSKAVNRQLFEDAGFLFVDAELGLSAPRGRQPKLDAACVVSSAGMFRPFTPNPPSEEARSDQVWDSCPRVTPTCYLKRIALVATVKSATSEISPSRAVQAPQDLYGRSRRAQGQELKVAGQTQSQQVSSNHHLHHLLPVRDRGVDFWARLDRPANNCSG